jgi:hypothetical protein
LQILTKTSCPIGIRRQNRFKVGSKVWALLHHVEACLFQPFFRLARSTISNPDSDALKLAAMLIF